MTRHPQRWIRLSAGNVLQLPLLPLPSYAFTKQEHKQKKQAEKKKKNCWLTQWWGEGCGGCCSDTSSNHLRARDYASPARWLWLEIIQTVFSPVPNNSLTCTEVGWLRACIGAATGVTGVLEMTVWLCHLPPLRNGHLVVSWACCNWNTQQGWQQIEIQTFSFFHLQLGYVNELFVQT